MGDPVRTTLDHLIEGFQIIDPQWRYVYVNPVAAGHGRTTPEQLEGRTMMEAYPGIDGTPLFAILRRCMSERTSERMENLFEFPNGSKRWFELRIEPVPDGLCIHSVDIDDRKRAEAAIRTTNFDLERRVAERTKELEAMNRELDAYSYSIAHDLRAPLRSIDGFAQLLVDDCGEVLNDVGKRHLERIRSAAQRMGTLIDDLLSLSRVGRLEVIRHETNLSEIARTVAGELGEREPGRKVTWRIDADLRALCDPALARIALENLLDNAWKFTAHVKAAEISVVSDPEGADAIVIEDNGVGFDMARSRHLFTPFQRLHTTDEFPGTGIGLSIVSRIIRKHAGFVRLESVVGRGTRVTLSFERSEPRTSDAPPDL